MGEEFVQLYRKSEGFTGSGPVGPEVLPSRWRIWLCWTAGRTRRRCAARRSPCWMGWRATATWRRRWSWAGRRATAPSRCSARGRCCTGWWMWSRRSGCSDPCCSAAPGWCTVTGEWGGGGGGHSLVYDIPNSVNKLFSVLITGTGTCGLNETTITQINL